MFIAFLGCDGSGKSAVISLLSERMNNLKVVVDRGHWRPNSLDANSNTVVTADDPHGQTPRGTVSSVVKLGWLWLNWWIGWWKYLRPTSLNGIVIFDRYHADLLVDPKRYRYGGPSWMARITTRFMPQPDCVIFLDADPDVLLSRKQEVSRDALEASRKKYLALCGTHTRFHIVDASQSLDKVIDDVMALLIPHIKI